MDQLQQITTDMHTIEARMQELNLKHNFQVEGMTADEYLEYENLQISWDNLKVKRDRLKTTTVFNQSGQAVRVFIPTK